MGVAVLLSLVTGLMVFPGLVDRRSWSREDAAVRAEDRMLALETHVHLMRENRLSLVLRPQVGTLTLYSGATPLREWPVYDARAGGRRVRQFSGEEDGPWIVRHWAGARIDPAPERPRTTIVVDSIDVPDPAGADPWIPPLPEEAVPTPSRFLVHFDGGLGLEVVGGEGGIPAVRGRAAPRPRPTSHDEYLIRLTMPSDEAGALYRSFPTDAVFLVLYP